MSRWENLQYHILLGLSQAVGKLPDWFLYGILRRTLYVVLYRIVRYRLKVVRDNLAGSFPEKSAEELRAIEKEFYMHLSELFVDTIDLSSISAEELLGRINIVNLKEHEEAVAGKDWIAALAHYGSWEYFMGYQLLTGHQFVGVYKPLVSKVFDEFYKTVRSRFGTKPVAMHSVMRYIVKERSAGEPRTNLALALIADQSPLWSDIHCWFEFLDRPTPFFEGIERLSLKFGMPVYFMKLRKTGVGRYDVSFEMIYDGVSRVEPYQIVYRYVDKLEQAIREQPAYWMWSHRRWKRRPETAGDKKIPYLRKDDMSWP